MLTEFGPVIVQWTSSLTPEPEEVGVAVGILVAVDVEVTVVVTMGVAVGLNNGVGVSVAGVPAVETITSCGGCVPSRAENDTESVLVGTSAKL